MAVDRIPVFDEEKKIELSLEAMAGWPCVPTKEQYDADDYERSGSHMAMTLSAVVLKSWEEAKDKALWTPGERSPIKESVLLMSMLEDVARALDGEDDGVARRIVGVFALNFRGGKQFGMSATLLSRSPDWLGYDPNFSHLADADGVVALVQCEGGRVVRTLISNAPDGEPISEPLTPPDTDEAKALAGVLAYHGVGTVHWREMASITEPPSLMLVSGMSDTPGNELVRNVSM